MKELWNKLLLFFLCASLLPLEWAETSLVVSCITALIIFSMTSCFNGGRPRAVLCLTALALCLYAPYFSCFIPLLAYDTIPFFSSKKMFPLFLGAALLCTVWFSAADLSPCSLGSYIFVLFLSCLLRFYTDENKKLHVRFHRFRDESTEKSILLKKKNEALIQSQNNEINLATLQERNRIAREIHDNVGHLLTRSILQTGALKTINRDPALTDALTDLQATLNCAMENIRESVHDLHDESIHLKLALEDIIQDFPDLEISLSYHMDEDVPKDIKYAFIAIVKEAVNNIIKHSDADQVKISASEHPALYQLLIHDNGTHANPIRETGIGLKNMEERVSSLGGNIHFSTEHGFRIFISILKKDAANGGNRL